jgi:hypothetical protein
MATTWREEQAMVAGMLSCMEAWCIWRSSTRQAQHQQAHARKNPCPTLQVQPALDRAEEGLDFRIWESSRERARITLVDEARTGPNVLWWRTYVFATRPRSWRKQHSNNSCQYVAHTAQFSYNTASADCEVQAYLWSSKKIAWQKESSSDTSFSTVAQVTTWQVTRQPSCRFLHRTIRIASTFSPLKTSPCFVILLLTCLENIPSSQEALNDYV